MSESDYFSYKAEDNQSHSSGSNQSKVSKHFRLNSNTAISPPSKGPSNPASPGSKYIPVPSNIIPNNIGNNSNSSSTINQFLAPQNSVNSIRNTKRTSTKSIYQFPSGSNNSSRNSSRRPSSGNLSNLAKLTSPVKVNMKLETNLISENQKRNSLPGSNTDSNISTPTLVLPAELASLTTRKSSSMLTSPQQATNPNIHRSPSFHDPNHNIHNTASTPPQEAISSNSSSRSISFAQSSTLNLRAFKKQYVLNEKLYLDKMRNSLHGDDYYTRKIGPPSSINDDDDYYDDIDIDIDDPFNSENSSGTPNLDDDAIEFGTTFVTSSSLVNHENLVTMSPKYVLHRLQWLKKSDPDNQTVNELFQKIQEKEYAYMKRQNSGLKPEYETPTDNVTDKLPTLDLQKEFLVELSNYPPISERFNWQTMLANVLKGDIVLSEKSKIAKQIKSPALNTQINDDIWFELKSWMNGKTKEVMIKSIKILRDSSDSIFEEILNFRIPDETETNADEIESLLLDITDKYYRVINYWPNLKQLKQEKPITKSETFVNRIAVFNSWLNIKTNCDIKTENLKNWVGNDELDVVKQTTDSTTSSGTSIYPHASRSFAEQVMKEKDIEDIFEKKIFAPISPWVSKTKIFLLQYQDTIEDINLQIDGDIMGLLLFFPVRLIKEIILIRLDFAKRLKNPTMMMVDQMIDDFSSYIKLSVQMKCSITMHCKDLPLNYTIDPEFDSTVLEAISYLFTLLHLKILDYTKRSFKTFKEPEILLKYWEELKNVGQYIDNAGKLIANEFNKLTLRILHKLNSYLLHQQDSPPSFTNKSDAERWLVEVFENLGSMKRKLNRFTNVLTRAFQNSVNYEIQNHKDLLTYLKDSDHFLIYTGGNLEGNGVYLIGSSELLGCEDEEIMRILNNSDIGSDLIPTIEINNSLALFNTIDNYSQPNIRSHYTSGYPDNLKYQNGSIHNVFSNSSMNKNFNESERDKANTSGLYPSGNDYNEVEKEMAELELKLQSLGYILVLCPAEPMLWEGDMYNLSGDTPPEIEKLKLKLKPNKLILLNQGSSYALEYQTDRFQQVASDTVSFIERRCSFSSVESNLQRINRAYFRFTYNVLNNYPKIFYTFKENCPNLELLNSIFLFTRDFGSNFLKINIANLEKKSIIILLMVRLSIKWLSFIVDDCDPTDQKTFRWCVPAMEFAMHMTGGYNILSLDESQFNAVKQKIAACMSLLISHFDVMGARALEAEKTTQQQRINIDIHKDVNDDAMLALNSDLRLKAIQQLENRYKRNPRQIGKVLDDADKGNKYLLSLASSLSNVSIRWQKRAFVGGGTFGKVYSAVNLDNGEILAVKEIRIQDTKTMKKIFPSIKEEMDVLEMLNHPNIVQYYGVEVHREKVNIFMEYCEGGSLASLLEHGRIEDEMVTQVYTLELLEGLAYLHQSGVVHRDIKPENILLDFNGVIKYVDFGAAKKIARNSTIMSNLSIESAKEQSKSASKATNNENEYPTGVQEMMGTPMYMAPESITGSTNKGRFGTDDVWSLGCVVLEMITGRRPWFNLDNEWAIMYHVAAGHTPQLPAKEEVSEAGRHFLKKSLVQDPRKRATAVELLMDPWIEEIRELAFGPTEDDQSTTSSIYEADTKLTSR